MGRRDSGFTLFELMVCIAILSILVSLAYTNWLEYLPKYRVNSATEELFTDLMWAKTKAISKNKEYFISFDISAKSYTVYYNDGGSQVTVKTVSIPAKYPNIQFGRNSSVGIVSGSSGTSAITFSGSPPRAEFNPTGTAKAGTIYLMPTMDTNRNDRHRAITVLATGRIRTYKYDSGSWK